MQPPTRQARANIIQKTIVRDSDGVSKELDHKTEEDPAKLHPNAQQLTVSQFFSPRHTKRKVRSRLMKKRYASPRKHEEKKGNMRPAEPELEIERLCVDTACDTEVLISTSSPNMDSHAQDQTSSSEQQEILYNGVTADERGRRHGVSDPSS